MTKVWCVRGEFGKLTPDFLKGGYVAIGWLPNNDLSGCTSRDDIVPLYKAEYPLDTSNVVIGQQVGQISRFLLEMKAGDTVITPDGNTEFLHHGVIQDDPSYRHVRGGDNCPYAHRRLVEWSKTPLLRSALSEYDAVLLDRFRRRAGGGGTPDHRTGLPCTSVTGGLLRPLPGCSGQGT